MDGNSPEDDEVRGCVHSSFWSLLEPVVVLFGDLVLGPWLWKGVTVDRMEWELDVCRHPRAGVPGEQVVMVIRSVEVHVELCGQNGREHWRRENPSRGCFLWTELPGYQLP